MNEEIRFAARVRHSLNRGLQLEPRAAQRLRAARERALARHRALWQAEHVPAGALARLGAPGLVARFGGLGGFSLRLVLPLVLLVIGLAGIYRWERNQRAADVEELDAQLLTDDLPIDAYLDRGFEAWLKRNSRRADIEGG